MIGIACALLLLEFFLPAEPDRQTWPEQLLLQRQALEEQKEEAHWRNRLAEAGENQPGLEQAAMDAITAGNFLAAYKACGLLKPGAKRERILNVLYAKARASCATLGWALAALEELDAGTRNRLAQELLNKWEDCQASRQ